ncbi:MAG: flavin prenyltransferase UbiX [Candidatus Caenarcaniphilales bacterium]|nr:flavin prenyltransferase UbiX [Candidatus Caenarcaniphilales bacterium]
MQKQTITLAITGASGSIYGMHALKFLLEHDYQVDLVLSETARKVMQLELDLDVTDADAAQTRKSVLKHIEWADEQNKLRLWHPDNLAARVSSGSYRTSGMLIMPCSMGAVGRIASGTSQDLIARCADVCLKERFKLVLVVREMPFNLIHLQNMLTLAQAGAIIAPAMPAFYHRPKTMNELIGFVVGKALDVFGIDNQLFERWLQTRV